MATVILASVQEVEGSAVFCLFVFKIDIREFPYLLRIRIWGKSLCYLGSLTSQKTEECLEFLCSIFSALSNAFEKVSLHGWVRFFPTE